MSSKKQHGPSKAINPEEKLQKAMIKEAKVILIFLNDMYSIYVIYFFYMNLVENS